jgi:peroxiredoxin
MNRRGLRKTVLLVTAGVAAVGIALAVIVSVRTAASPVQIVNVSPPPQPAAVPATATVPATVPPRDALAAAADALGFRQSNQADVGLVENLPPDTQLMAPSATVLPVGTAAPDFVLATATGERVKLSDFRGKTVLLEFFATWCPHCQAEAAHLQRLHAALPASDFAFLSVNADSEDAPSLYAFDRFFHVPWPTLLDPGTPAGSYVRAGGAGPVTRAYGVGLYPTFYIIDAKGRVAWRNDREQPDLLLSQKLHDAAGK